MLVSIKFWCKRGFLRVYGNGQCNDVISLKKLIEDLQTKVSLNELSLLDRPEKYLSKHMRRYPGYVNPLLLVNISVSFGSIFFTILCSLTIKIVYRDSRIMYM